MGGTASLFSEEFYDFIPHHLNEDGLFVQWLQLYEIDLPLVASVLRAMLPNFNDVNAYLANDGDLILVASVNGRVPPVSDFLDADSRHLQEEMRRIGVESSRDLQDGFALDARGLRSLVELIDVQPNSDFYPYLQLASPERRFIQSRVSTLGEAVSAPWPLAATLGGFEVRDVTEALPSLVREIAIDRKLRAAREIREAMISGAPIEAHFTTRSDATQMYALRGLGQSCLLDTAPEQATQMIFSLAMETAAFLSPQDNAPLWGDPAWVACKPQDPLVAGALEFVGAVGRADDVETIRIGGDLLGNGTSSSILTSADSIYFVRGAMQHAALRIGDSDLARELIVDYDHLLSDELRKQPLLLMLNSMSTESGSIEGSSSQRAALE